MVTTEREADLAEIERLCRKNAVFLLKGNAETIEKTPLPCRRQDHALFVVILTGEVTE